MSRDSLADELLQRRAEIAAELQQMTSPPESGVNLSFGKRVGDGTTEAVERIATTATARSLSGSIDEIDRALQKIEAGTYGVCDRCGSPIARERLRARPASAICVGCAS